MKEEKISIYRVLSIAGIFLSVMAATLILFTVNKKEMDEFLCAIFLIFGFMPILIFELGYQRRRGEIGNHTQTTYKRIFLGFLGASIIMAGSFLFPEYFRPMLLISLVLSAFCNQIIGISGALFLVTLMSVATGAGVYEILAYILLIVTGSLFAKVLTQKEYQIYVAVFFLSISVFVPNLFYYLANEELLQKNLLFGLVNGMIAAFFAFWYYPEKKERTENEIPYCYERILEDDYKEVKEVRSYSWSEYRHARRVSDIAYKYAKSLGFRADLASAAGFYYRLGRWENGQAVSGAVSRATELCFPDEMVQILSEYYGEENLPSTPESALVQIIDSIVIRIEVLDREVGTSQWNRGVLVTQTMNDYSEKGIYDRSGLSINAFLKIREWLTKEELL